MTPSRRGNCAWYAATSASVIARAQKPSKWCSARPREAGAATSGCASSSRCHHVAPAPVAPTPTKSGGPPCGEWSGGKRIGGEVGEVAPQRHVDVRRHGGELEHLRLVRRAQPVEHVVPQRLLVRGLRRAAPLLEPVVPVLGVDAEEGERAPVLVGRLGDALLVLEDEQLGLVVVGEQPPQLGGVASALDRVG